jgi:hypothetical protein
MQSQNTLIKIKMNQNNDKIMKKVRKTRRELIKQNILSEKEHKSHNNKKLIPSRRQCLAFSCKCKSYAKFSDQQLRYVFKQYYDLKSHSKQRAYLRGIQNLCQIIIKFYKK